MVMTAPENELELLVNDWSISGEKEDDLNCDDVKDVTEVEGEETCMDSIGVKVTETFLTPQGRRAG